ncbi:MAG: hypothetical protein WBQ68_10290 [Terriglobales bacterium]
MSADSGTTRWWEYYLPRYLMPSVAGVAIVNWLCSYGGDGLRSLLSLPLAGKALDTSSLILLFLYGNLFCYIASYPVLVFHATRVMDFPKGKWRAPRRPVDDGYIITVVFMVGAFFFHLVPPQWRYWLAFPTSLIIAAVQLRRLWIVASHRFDVRRHGDLVSPAYFYSYVLAHRRGLPVLEEVRETAGPTDSTPAKPEYLPEEDEEEKEEIKTTRSRTNLWRKEFMDTYRHLREHGNSAFIFLLEVVLAALTFCVITKPGQSSEHQLAATGLLFAIWATPSVFVHLLAQQ